MGKGLQLGASGRGYAHIMYQQVCVQHHMYSLFFFLFLYCRQSNIKWDTELLANYHPSYYGMMVAKFLPIRATNSSRQGEL